MSAAEVPFHVFFRVAPFLVGDHDAAMRPEFGEPARHRFVVAENAVAVELDPVRETACDVIERERPLNVASELDALPGREGSVNLPASFADLGFHRLDLG